MKIRPWQPADRDSVVELIVAETHRGGGVANDLAETALAWSSQNGLDLLFLGTTSLMTRADRFYERLGFESIPPYQLPDTFPRMAVDSIFYRRHVMRPAE